MSGGVRQIIDSIRDEIIGYFAGVGVGDVSQAASFVLGCNGTIHLTGTGSLSYVAKKLSQTLVSVNVRCAYLHALDALHGDIGNVHEGDVVFMLSKSGNCQELKQLIPCLREKKSTLVTVTSTHGSSLCDHSDHNIIIQPSTSSLPPTPEAAFEHELTSQFDTFVLMLFDTLAVFVVYQAQLSKSDYAQNHPGGKIGRHLKLRVRDVLIPWEDLPLVHKDMLGIQMLTEMASKSKGYGCVLVVDRQRRLKGTISDADFRRAILRVGERSMTMSVSELMNFAKKFPRTCKEDARAIVALNMMNQAPSVDYLPVLNTTHEVVGLITTTSLQRAGI
ncbi:MAG: hypothetical protein CMB32_03640 [Euryarchaeota archaeon]|nr:hypothetical protein [Euryarchaeota archaeon]